LATLLIKTLAKPVSKRIKRDFSRYQSTRKMLIGIGQSTHSITSRMTIWSEGYTVRRIPPLEEENALGRGADFVGEAFILMVSIGTMSWEYVRSKEKEALKEAKQRAEAKAERDALQANFLALDARLRAVEEVVEYNSSSILNIAGKSYDVTAKQRKLVPINDDAKVAQEKDNATGMETAEGTKNNHNAVLAKPHHVLEIHQPEPYADENESNNSKPWWKFW